jgi:hypothetical protein
MSEDGRVTPSQMADYAISGGVTTQMGKGALGTRLSRNVPDM